MTYKPTVGKRYFVRLKPFIPYHHELDIGEATVIALLKDDECVVRVESDTYYCHGQYAIKHDRLLGEVPPKIGLLARLRAAFQ